MGVLTGELPVNICASDPARLALDLLTRSPAPPGPRALSAEAFSRVFWIPLSCLLPPGLMRSFDAADGPVGVEAG